MQVINQSRHYDAVFHKLVRFAVSYFRNCHQAVVFVRDQDPRKAYSSGTACKVVEWTEHKFDEPGVVELRVTSGKCRSYPAMDPWYFPEVGVPVYLNWTEEVLYLLAHELQHIDDFWDGFCNETIEERYHLEIRAEQKAHEVLAAWRTALTPTSAYPSITNPRIDNGKMGNVPTP